MTYRKPLKEGEVRSYSGRHHVPDPMDTFGNPEEPDHCGFYCEQPSQCDGVNCRKSRIHGYTCVEREEAKPDTRVSVQDIKDMVVMPNHYARFKIEPIYFIQENNLTPLQGKVVKYIVRYPFKNGAEDIKKAIRCAEMLLKREQGDPDWWKKPE